MAEAADISGDSEAESEALKHDIALPPCLASFMVSHVNVDAGSPATPQFASSLF